MEIIVTKQERSVQFGSLNEGNVFSLGKENHEYFYLKLPEIEDQNEDTYNAFCLADQDYYFFTKEERVKTYSAKMVLEED